MTFLSQLNLLVRLIHSVNLRTKKIIQFLSILFSSAEYIAVSIGSPTKG